MKQFRSNKVTGANGRSAGFSLLELIVVVSILAILAGAAVPVSRKLIDRAARKATESELSVLADAAGRYFEDTSLLPLSLDQLIYDSDAPGWTGPYLQSLGNDIRSGLHSALVDGWSQEYSVTLESESVLLITSPGPDGQLGELLDYSIRLDVTSIRRQQTIQTLEILNQAIGHYNALNSGSLPLPIHFDELLSLLVTNGFLPEREGFTSDGWGQPFVADPPRKSPVVRVQSPSMFR